MIRGFSIMRVTALCTVLAAFFLIGCEVSIPDPWPTDFSDLFSFTQSDPEDDVELEVFGDPSSPYAVSYFRIDVTEVSIGMVLDEEQVPEDDYLYIRVDNLDPAADGILDPEKDNVDLRPTDPQPITDQPDPPWPAGAETIVEHNPQLGFDVDNDDMTGDSRGNEVTFDMSFVYGGTNSFDGSYSLPPPENVQGDLSGELCVWCGSGRYYFVVRYDIADLKEYISSGTTVTVNYYCSTVCADSDGNELGTAYFARDEAAPASWEVPW